MKLTDEKLEELRQDSIHERFIAGSEARRLIMELRAYKSQVEEMRKILEWYADADNHNKLIFDKYAPYTRIDEDSGERARTLLQYIQGGNTL